MAADGASGAVGAAAGWKLIGGAAGAYGIGAALAAVVVMLMTPPRSPREWAVGLISTVVLSICGGAMVVERLGLHSWVLSTNGLLALLGLCFACGLPAWAVVRWVFTWMERRRGKDIGEVVAEVRGQIKGS
jgi:hypothetical protein